MEKFDVFKLLGNKTRFKIFMKLLEFDELCVSELEELLGLKQANTSKHLIIFKQKNVVVNRRDKNLIKYRVSKKFIQDNTDLIRYLMI